MIGMNIMAIAMAVLLVVVLVLTTGSLLLEGRQPPSRQFLPRTAQPQQFNETQFKEQQLKNAETSDRILSELKTIKTDIKDLKANGVQFYNPDDMTARHEDRFWDKLRHQKAMDAYQRMLDVADRVRYDARALHSLVPVTFECDRNYFQRYDK